MYEASFFVGGSVVNRERMSVIIEILVLFLKCCSIFEYE